MPPSKIQFTCTVTELVNQPSEPNESTNPFIGEKGCAECGRYWTRPKDSLVIKLKYIRYLLFGNAGSSNGSRVMREEVVASYSVDVVFV